MYDKIRVCLCMITDESSSPVPALYTARHDVPAASCGLKVQGNSPEQQPGQIFRRLRKQAEFIY